MPGNINEVFAKNPLSALPSGGILYVGDGGDDAAIQVLDIFPNGATANALFRADGTSGTKLKTTNIIVDDDDNVSGVDELSADSVKINVTAGSVLFAGTAGVLTQNNANLFFDSATERFGVGTNTPQRKLHVYGASTFNLARFESATANVGPHLEYINLTGTATLSFMPSDAVDAHRQSAIEYRPQTAGRHNFYNGTGVSEVDLLATFNQTGINFPSLTARRLIGTDSNKYLASEDLNDWIVGTANRITAADDTFGGIEIDIASNYVGQNTITTLGTIATGVWNATAINGDKINYNTTNLKVTSTQLNTIQDIATTSTPRFARLGLGTAASATSTIFTSGIGDVGQGVVLISGITQPSINPAAIFHVTGTIRPTVLSGSMGVYLTSAAVNYLSASTSRVYAFQGSSLSITGVGAPVAIMGLFRQPTGATMNKAVHAHTASVGSSYEEIAAPTDGLLVEGDVYIGATSGSYKLSVTGTGGFTDNVTVGVTNDLITDTRKIVVRSNGYAGIELNGDSSGEGTEPGGAYVYYTTDALGLECISGICQNAGFDPRGNAFAGTSNNAFLFGHLDAFPLQLGTAGVVRYSITNTGQHQITGDNATIMHVTQDDGTNAINLYCVNTGASGSTSGALLILSSEDGAALANGHRLGGLGWRGSTGAATVSGSRANLVVEATENWTTTANGTELQFFTTPNGSTSAGRTLTLENTSTVTTANNLSIGTTAVNFQSLVKGIFITNRSAAPTGNPTGGGFLYAESGALRWRGSSGTTTTIASA